VLVLTRLRADLPCRSASIQRRSAGRLEEFVRGRTDQAVAIAEKMATGKAVKVEVEHEHEHEHEHDHVQFDVFVRSGDSTKKFKIDGLSGKVL
jgi:hypothetical protein